MAFLNTPLDNTTVKQCLIYPAQMRKDKPIYIKQFPLPQGHNLNVRALRTEMTDILQPPLISDFQNYLDERKEKDYYRVKYQPLGSFHKTDLPPHIDRLNTTFGIASDKSEFKVSEVVNPLKSREQVEKESKLNQNFYCKSHGSWSSGEQIDRNYKAPFNKTDLYGKKSTAGYHGKLVKEVLLWEDKRKNQKITPLETTFLKKFKESRSSGLPKVTIKDIKYVNSDTTFGISSTYDLDTVADVIFNRQPRTFPDTGRGELGLLLADLHKQLHYTFFNGFNDLIELCKYFDYENSGKININWLLLACERLNLGISQELLMRIINFCNQGDNKIDYLRFLDYMNWQNPPQYIKNIIKVSEEHQDKLKKEEEIMEKRKERLMPSDPSLEKAAGKDQQYYFYGSPETYSALSPDVFNNRNIFIDDLNKLRPKKEIRDIFCTLVPDDKEFEKYWALAVPENEASIDFFLRVVKDERRKVLKEYYQNLSL